MEPWRRQVVTEVPKRGGGFWVDQITAKRDVLSDVAVDGVVGALLKQQVNRVHELQTDHDTLTVHFSALVPVSVERHGLHLQTVLHQHDRQHFFWKLSNRK